MNQGEITVTGMVLAAYPQGESDKRLVILTREKGKITAFARGARRPGSPLLASANPFAFGEFTVYAGRNAYTLVRAKISNYFREVAADYESACYGFYLLEMAEYYSVEGQPEKEMLNLLYIALRALESGKFTRRLIRLVYELRMLKIQGEYPDLFEENALGGKVSESVLYAMQFVVSCDLKKLFTFTLTPAAEKEFSSQMESIRKAYIGHEFKSEIFL